MFLLDFLSLTEKCSKNIIQEVTKNILIFAASSTNENVMSFFAVSEIVPISQELQLFFMQAFLYVALFILG